MTDKTKFAIAIPIVLALGAGSAVWWILGRGFSVRGEPPAIEAFVARRLRALAMPRAAKDAGRPVARTPEVLQEAMAHYADHCALCHANDGSGDTPIGNGLYPKPPDLRRRATHEKERIFHR